MDIDPLSLDTAPPRYNVESDDEEDEVRPLSVAAPASAPVTFEVSVTGSTPASKALLVATGDVGRRWARGAELGEQSAAVYVNKVQIGLVFQPTWTQSSIIISEALSRLPLAAMHPYAKTILDTFKPKSLALLDSYPVPTYATDVPIPFYEAPVRYLSTAGDTAFLTNSTARPFAPPNLVQSTSAAFLALASLPSPSSSSTPSSIPSTPTPPAPAPPQIPTTLLLLPAAHIPPSAPKDILPSNINLLNPGGEDDGGPTPELVHLALGLAFGGLGESVEGVLGGSGKGSKGDGGKVAEKAGKRRTEVGEGGMYI